MTPGSFRTRLSELRISDSRETVSGSPAAPPGVMLFARSPFLTELSLQPISTTEGNLNEKPFLNPELENLRNEGALHITEDEAIDHS